MRFEIVEVIVVVLGEVFIDVEFFVGLWLFVDLFVVFFFVIFVYFRYEERVVLDQEDC